ncbi:MAG TPA: hypothetical protein VML54_05795 [Candidatus Limnocylindrales bacterium]|nr:hypothetical protein [Candidatus Limnocylindrales bacterium]
MLTAADLEAVCQVVRAELRAVGLRPSPPPGPGPWRWDDVADAWGPVPAAPSEAREGQETKGIT